MKKIFSITILLLAMGGGIIFYMMSSKDSPLADTKVRKVVTAFGNNLKNVSLLSPTASSQIRQQYSPYVSDSLLDVWTKNPKEAPGRLTSSPWPERIKIIKVQKRDAQTVNVQGQIILMTSVEKASKADDNAGTKTIHLVLEKKKGSWEIISFHGDKNLHN